MCMHKAYVYCICICILCIVYVYNILYIAYCILQQVVHIHNRQYAYAYAVHICLMHTHYAYALCICITHTYYAYTIFLYNMHLQYAYTVGLHNMPMQCAYAICICSTQNNTYPAKKYGSLDPLAMVSTIISTMFHIFCQGINLGVVTPHNFIREGGVIPSLMERQLYDYQADIYTIDFSVEPLLPF